MPLDQQDRDYLAHLVHERDGAADDASCYDHYCQGRIDEYCSQNAIDQADTDLALRLDELYA